MSGVTIVADETLLACVAADRFISLALGAIQTHGQFAVALSGGETPLGMYRQLARPDYASRVPWNAVHFFWGDERCVPPDHPESNYRLVQETLLSHIQIPDTSVHRIPGELDPRKGAVVYENLLRAFFVKHAREQQLPQPKFDLILLGLGEDGHTASLFPNAPALHESVRWVMPYYLASSNTWRITLTPLAINAAQSVMFLVSGRRKATILRDVVCGSSQPDRFPAQAIHPTHGTLDWFVDAEATSHLP